MQTSADQFQQLQQLKMGRGDGGGGRWTGVQRGVRADGRADGRANEYGLSPLNYTLH